MPDMENTEGQGQEQQLPEKFKGKSAAEIAAMYEALESKLGEQGSEIGQLRQLVADLSVAARASTREREAADKSDYKSRYARYAEDLIVSPEETLPKLIDELKQELRSEVLRDTSTQLTAQQQIEAFFRANPELDQYREIVSVIGERIYQMNPQRPLNQILDLTKQESLKYIGSLKERMSGRKAQDEERRRNAITTSGGRAREGVTGDESEERPEERGTEQDSVLAEIQRIKEFRAKRIQPPRARG